MYDSSDGWFPSNSDINAASALIGGGVNFYWDTPLPRWGSNSDIAIGPVKNLGLLYNPGTGQVGFSIGLTISIPWVNVSVPVDPQAIGPAY